MESTELKEILAPLTLALAPPFSPGHLVNTEPISSVLRYLDKFGSSETGTDRFLKKSVPRKFGSVSVFTEQYRISHREDVIAGSKTNFDIIS